MTSTHEQDETSLITRIHQLITDPTFVRFHQLVDVPNIFRIVGQKNYERWHSGFWAWLLDINGSHGLGSYPLELFILHALTNDSVQPDNIEQKRKAFATLPMWIGNAFEEFEIHPNERGAGEKSAEIKNKQSYFDIYINGHTTFRSGDQILPIQLSVMVEMKVKAASTVGQATQYADFFEKKHMNPHSLLVYILPSNRVRDSVQNTIGDSRWCIVTYQSLHDKVLTQVMEHHKLSNHARWVISEYINNLRTERKGETMAVTNEERELAKALTAKYSSTFDAIWNILYSANNEGNETSTQPNGAKRPDIAVKVDGKSYKAKTFKQLARDVVTDLYKDDKLDGLMMPWGTGSSRHFIVVISPEQPEPVHINGNAFVQPEYVVINGEKRFAIETNISRDGGLNMLRKLCAEVGVALEVISQ